MLAYFERLSILTLNVLISNRPKIVCFSWRFLEIKQKWFLSPVSVKMQRAPQKGHVFCHMCTLHSCLISCKLYSLLVVHSSPFVHLKTEWNSTCISLGVIYMLSCNNYFEKFTHQGWFRVIGNCKNRQKCLCCFYGSAKVRISLVHNIDHEFFSTECKYLQSILVSHLKPRENR